MWNWYSNAAICLAYLADVEHEESDMALSQSFCQSEWFDRGWTLQELLAPRKILFLGANWEFIGYKSYDQTIQYLRNNKRDLEFPSGWQYEGYGRYDALIFIHFCTFLTRDSVKSH